MRTVFALLFALVITGCAHSGKRMDAETLSLIVPGSTTKEQMIQMFGNPLSQAYGTEGKLSAVWFYVQVGPFGAGMKQQNLAVLFDQSGRVERYSLADNVNEEPITHALPTPAPASTSAPSQPLGEQAYKNEQVRQLMQKNLPYDEYQRQYKSIMGQ
ncbi:outer membrane protein assembly factor BamE [Pseudomonas sp. NA-150]|uniref:outer membrane protein assembly factor BamE domain-containing protein n=1 Tax=Pseudomonas sp. NA-150 TaxID=3367525 RepID=UPI0037CAFDB4